MTETRPETADHRQPRKFDRHTFVVVLDGVDGNEEVYERVVVRMSDRLQGEQMAAQLDMPEAARAPQTQMALYCWASLRRTKTLKITAEKFLNSLVDVDKLDEAPESVDPTQPGPGSDSP